MRRIGVAASLALHALAVLLLLPWPWPWRHAASPPPAPLATVELVVQDTPSVGSGPASRPAPGDVPAKAATPGVPAPADAPGAGAPSSPAPTAAPTPAPPSPAAAPAPAAAPDIRLGDEGAGTGLVSGPDVVPAGPDPRFRNVPPAYPVEAGRRHEQGAVLLLIHIAPDGTARAVEVTQSSGWAALDRAAREAVRRWHFRPAQQDGIPVDSELPFRIVFAQD